MKYFSVYSAQLAQTARGTVGRLVAILAILSLPLINAQPVAAMVVPGATIVVNTTADGAPADDGVCTLREAIFAANNNAPSGVTTGECAAGTAGLDTITFDTTQAVFQSNATIAATSSLPAITAPVVISGQAVYDYASSHDWVKVQGVGGSSYGFTFSAGSAGSAIDRLIIVDWDRGAQLDGGNVTITDNRFGVDFDGTTLATNTYGIAVNSSNNVIGGLDVLGAPRGNVIAGAALIGIALLSGSNNIIQSNRIGTDADGTAALGEFYGVHISHGVVKTTMGGSKPLQGNVISGNSYGIFMESGVSATKIMRNFFGLGADGTTHLGNTIAGIDDQGGLATVIGGTMPQASNFFGYNHYAIELGYSTPPGTVTITGNIIGLDASAAFAPNTDGIFFVDAPVKTVIKGNLIANNGDGINFSNENPVVSVSQNCIFNSASDGVLNTGALLDVHGNWWGDASGPNPPGSGDNVSGTLKVMPWLTKPPTSCLGWAPQSLNPKNQSFWNKKATPTMLMWKRPPTASKYTWELDKDGPVFDSGNNVTVPPYPSEGPLDYGLYKWIVDVKTAEGVSWGSGWYTFYVTIQKSPKPGQVLPSSVNASGIKFAWSAYLGASTYTLYTSTNSDCSAATSYPGLTGTTFNPGPGLFPPGDYYWQVLPDNLIDPMPCQPFTVAP